jgi:hypothetical protein
MRIQTRRGQIQELQAENRRLAKIQELIVDNILAVQESETTYTGNRYKSYQAAVVEVANKYSGVSDYGVLQVGNIVDLRAAYIIGQGLKISKDVDRAADEYRFAERFISVNKLDHELPQELARESEIEGKTLIKLIPIVRPGTADGSSGVDIGIRWISWTTNKYRVVTNPEDYLQIEKVSWKTKNGEDRTLLPTECVYARFAGRYDVPDETMPRVAKCLTQIENLDMALRDWRQINRLYAAPTPDFQCETAEQAKAVNEKLEKLNWKIGKAFAHTGVFSYKQPSAEGQKALESEIMTLMRVISGTTGIPINALGCPELTTKYGADSQAMLDLISMSTSKEREIWRGAYQELIEKAMLMWNARTGKTPLDPSKIKVEIPAVTAEQWARIVSTWLPLRNSDVVTRKTVLNQIPGMDAEAETKALEEEDAVNMEKFASQKIKLGEDEEEE